MNFEHLKDYKYIVNIEHITYTTYTTEKKCIIKKQVA